MSMIDFTKINLFNFKKNIFYVLLVISIIILIKNYQSYHNEVKEKKSIYIYEQMLSAYKKKDFITVLYLADKIEVYYKKTTYSNIVKLFLAKHAFSKQKYKKTKRYLKNMKYNKCSDHLLNIINERLVKIYIEQKKWKKALVLLKYYDKNNNISILQEIKGDIYIKINELERAKISYVKSLSITSNSEDCNFLKMKIRYLDHIV